MTGLPAEAFDVDVDRDRNVDVAADDARLGAAGLAGLVAADGLWVPLRLPAADVPLLHPELALRARMPAGGRFSFVTTATALAWPVQVGALAGSDYPVGPFDVLIGGELLLRRRIHGSEILEVALPAGPSRVEIWLPHYGCPRLGRLTLTLHAPAPDSARPTLEAAPDARPHLIVYGSSISQCREAPGPTETWPALVARSGGWNLRCLGFGGQCHLDPPVARFIRDHPADLIVLGAGINIHGAATFSARSLGPSLEGFIATIRSGHPGVPIVVVTPLVSPDREAEPNAVGLTLSAIRTIVADAVAGIRLADPLVHLIDGLSVLGHDDAHLLVDGLHPGPEGYGLIADRMLARIDALHPHRR